MGEGLVTVGTEVFDRATGHPGWAVLATYARTDSGDPVCVEYRVRALRGATPTELVVNLHSTLGAMEGHAVERLAGSGSFSRTGIPRYVFEQASQGKLIERARAKMRRDAEVAAALTPEARAILAPPGRRVGRPPVRSTAEKLRILAAVEEVFRVGRPLEDVAKAFHMSRSSVRDLLSWARNDASPRLFEGSGPGRKGGGMTSEARSMLAALEGGDDRG